MIPTAAKITRVRFQMLGLGTLVLHFPIRPTGAVASCPVQTRLVIHSSRPKRYTLFGPLPTRGLWTALDLTRGQFLAILLLSVALFTFIGGPIWLHARASHFWRITLSYAAIPAGVTAALLHNSQARLARIIVASVVISLIKLIVTALLLVMIGVAQT